MASLPAATWLRFGLWLALGLLVYGFYSRRRSTLSTLTP
jgi:APA family basic amino acid/polyamine antiporter